jgi:hypothetical protein
MLDFAPVRGVIFPKARPAGLLVGDFPYHFSRL